MGGFAKLTRATTINLVYVAMRQRRTTHGLVHLTVEQARGFVPMAHSGFVAAFTVRSLTPRKTVLERRTYEE